jgi:uncharacterized phage protein (TIGR02218 family)
MTYDTIERSHQSGAPVELYLFARGEQVWRYTSADTDVSRAAETWTSTVLQRTAIETNPEQSRNAITVTAPRDFAVADLFRITAPTDVVSLTVYRYHRGDADTAVIWMGRVLNVQWQGAQARLSCEPISISFGRTGLRRLYQTSCPHVLYGSGCRLNKADFARVCEVDAISGYTLTVDGLDAMSYAGGFVEWDVGDSNIERRFIRSFSGLVLTLAQPFQGLEVGNSVTVYPGCNHTMQICNDDFDNLVNYGGMPFIPSKNPFDGTPVF